MNNINQDEIQETFYNVMIEITMDTINSKQIPNELIKSLMVKTLANICDNVTYITLIDGTKSYGFKTLRNMITRDNVPEIYEDLFNNLSGIIKHKSDNLTYISKLNKLVDDIMTLGTFNEIIDKVEEFYKDMNTETNSNVSVVSVETIRETFYNIMVDQYFSNINMFSDDVKTMESYIFICLSGYAITFILSQSRGVNGIKLYNGGIVTQQNCPREYIELFVILIELKKIFDKVNPNEEAIKLICQTVSMKPNLVIDSILLEYKTPEINNIISRVSELSIKISRLEHFKNIIGNVLEFCLDIS